MATSYLVDSNVLIDYVSDKFNGEAEHRLDSIFDNTFYYSIVSRMEVLGYNAPQDVILNMEGFLSNGNIFYVTDEISDQTILIRRKLPKLKLPDAIIAATALFYKHTLLTRNTDDFKNVPGLKLDSPWLWK